MDISDTITPRSDQLNAEDLLTGPATVTVVEVKRGGAEQPVDIVTAEYGPGRPYKPSKTMRRILIAAWGKDTTAYVGRRMTIYRDPEITFGRDKVGGIRISHMSHIAKPLVIALTVRRGSRSMFEVEPLPDETDEIADVERRINEAATLPELDAIAAELKAQPRRNGKATLLAAWNARRAALTEQNGAQQ